MSLPHAILGLLCKEPMTGYDLKTACFDNSVAHFWPADQSQIYRTLDKLVEQGWASSHLEIQHERPNRKVYRVTPEGQSELRRWLLQSQGLPTFRDPLLIQVFFGEHLTNEELVELLSTQLVAHQQLLASYEQMPEHLPLPPLNDPDIIREQVMHRLVLEMALSKESAYINWLKLAIETIQRLERQLNGKLSTS